MDAKAVLPRTPGKKEDEFMVTVRRVALAAGKCQKSVETFFEKAVLVGSPPQDFNLEREVQKFLRAQKGELAGFQYRVPKHVVAFTDRVLDFNCPRTCPKDCVNLPAAAY